MNILPKFLDHYTFKNQTQYTATNNLIIIFRIILSPNPKSSWFNSVWIRPSNIYTTLLYTKKYWYDFYYANELIIKSRDEVIAALQQSFEIWKVDVWKTSNCNYLFNENVFNFGNVDESSLCYGEHANIYLYYIK